MSSRSRALMIQGTGSSVGKSVLCAALCRIFHRRGIRVAPFKAQNMSNNAFATIGGGEIGRAQAVQAAAAGVIPTVDMNPVLLKPEGENGSQVVLRGRAWGRLRSADFLQRKMLLWDTVQASLRALQAEYELVVIEGAGSPAEINLARADIVNMRVAAAADAPVLLVGDIDRGGVFASLVGTMELLAPAEREWVRGFIINRFRGDLGLLRPGLEFLEERCGRPVFGVVPYLADIGLAEEDAAALPSRSANNQDRDGLAGATPRIAAIRLPTVANFDDLDPFLRAGVEVSWVGSPSELGRPDLIVLPGSKNTSADLEWMHMRELAEAVVELADLGAPVLGICGGYQMLGERVLDPDGVESGRRSTPGLGLLPLETVLDQEKAVRQTRGRILAGRGIFGGLAGEQVEGYEIHVGRTTGPGTPLLELQDRLGPRLDGRSARSGWIVGSYLHGLLDRQCIVEGVVRNLLGRRLSGAQSTQISVNTDPYDRLADHVEEALDLQGIGRLVGLELAASAGTSPTPPAGRAPSLSTSDEEGRR